MTRGYAFTGVCLLIGGGGKPCHWSSLGFSPVTGPAGGGGGNLVTGQKYGQKYATEQYRKVNSRICISLTSVY